MIRDYVSICSLDAPPGAVMAMPLSDEEQLVLERHLTSKRRREVNVSRRLMRYGLNNYLGLTEEGVEWSSTGPRYNTKEQNVGLGLSHSKSHVAAAFSAYGPIGVDIETTKTPRRWRQIMQLFFCPEDLNWITQQRPKTDYAGEQTRFLIIWTAREAYAKYYHESVFDNLSSPLPSLVDGEPIETIQKSEVQVDVKVSGRWVVALCRAKSAPMPECMINCSLEFCTVEPYVANFIFSGGGEYPI